MPTKSYFWGGTTVGDSGPYDDDEFSNIIRALFDATGAGDGVIMPYLNFDDSLLVTEAAPDRLSVAPGAAIVDGKIYISTETFEFVLELPGAGQYFYTVVLEKDFAAQTVRPALLGPDVVGGNLGVRNTGVLWQNPLSHIIVESTGIVFFYDYRTPARVNAFPANRATIVYKGYDQTILDVDTTSVTFQSEHIDQLELFTPDTDQIDFVLISNRCLYEIECCLQFEPAAAGICNMILWGEEGELGSDFQSLSADRNTTLKAKAYAWLEKDTAIKIHVSVYQDSGAPLLLLSGSYSLFSMKRVF